MLVFLPSDVIAGVLHNPDPAPLMRTLSFAFVVIPHGQQFRALMQKELEFNKIGMIETSAVLAFYLHRGQRPFLAAGDDRHPRLPG